MFPPLEKGDIGICRKQLSPLRKSPPPTFFEKGELGLIWTVVNAGVIFTETKMRGQAVSATLLEGKKLAEKMRQRIGLEVESWSRQWNRYPGLAVVLVGNHPSSLSYVRSKCRVCDRLNIKAFEHHLPDAVSEAQLLRLIADLNAQPEVDGILVQLPLPAGIRTERVLEAVDPAKDVDGFHPYNLGRLFAGQPVFVPCTALGIMDLIRSASVPPAGKNAVVVGRSLIVGKPAAALLLNEHATVTICHSRTRELAAECLRADILVVAVGKKYCISGEWIKPGAVVIDAGDNREDGKVFGDVEFEAAQERAAYITPVPGGVGPMTITRLMANTLQAARLRQEGGKSQ